LEFNKDLREEIFAEMEWPMGRLETELPKRGKNPL